MVFHPPQDRKFENAKNLKTKKPQSKKFEDANLKPAGLLAQEGPGHMSNLPWGGILYRPWA